MEQGWLGYLDRGFQSRLCHWQGWPSGLGKSKSSVSLCIKRGLGSRWFPRDLPSPKSPDLLFQIKITISHLLILRADWIKLIRKILFGPSENLFIGTSLLTESVFSICKILNVVYFHICYIRRHDLSKLLYTSHEIIGRWIIAKSTSYLWVFGGYFLLCCF